MKTSITNHFISSSHDPELLDPNEISKAPMLDAITDENDIMQLELQTTYKHETLYIHVNGITVVRICVYGKLEIKGFPIEAP